MLLSVARAVRALSLGVWLGGIIAVFVVIPAIFAYFGKQQASQAGELASGIFRTLAPVKIGFGLLALAAEAAVFFSKSPEAPNGWRKFLPNICLVLALIAMLVTALWLQPQMEHLREHMGRVIEGAPENPMRQQFRSLHGASMGLTVLEAIFVAVALIAGLL